MIDPQNVCNKITLFLEETVNGRGFFGGGTNVWNKIQMVAQHYIIRLVSKMIILHCVNFNFIFESEKKLSFLNQLLQLMQL